MKEKTRTAEYDAAGPKARALANSAIVRMVVLLDIVCVAERGGYAMKDASIIEYAVKTRRKSHLNRISKMYMGVTVGNPVVV